MNDAAQGAWRTIQTQADACPGCRSDPAFDTGAPAPARPPSAAVPAGILLVSEAPPTAGGFWRTGAYDDLREQLLTILRQLGLMVPENLHGPDALASFVNSGLFLVQALKWPLRKHGGRKRPNFNRLGASEAGRLIDHTASDHLGPEVDVLAPRAMLALGTAAWRATLALSPLAEPVGASSRLLDAREQRHELTLGKRAISLGVTLLPVAQNMRITERAGLIRRDIADSLGRHGWHP